MPARFVCSLTLVHVAALGFAFVLLSGSSLGSARCHAANLPNHPPTLRTILILNSTSSSRDQHGNPLDAAGAVHLSSARLNYNAIVPTQGASAAHFFNLGFGEYEWK